MTGVKFRYNTRQHNLSYYVRAPNGLSTDLVPQEKVELSKLERALTCGLPNEVDFAVNVATLLSGDGPRKLRINKSPFLVELFLGHAGIFRPGQKYNLL